MIGAALVLPPKSAYAMQLYSNANGLEINLDTTLSYGTYYRVNDPSAILTSPTGNANGSEGDINFRHGFFSNQFEVVPVLDIKDGSFGAHFSGEAYLNTVYLQKNQNNQPGTLNPFSVATNTDFTSATRNIEGENAKLLDAFAYDTVHFGAGNSQTLSFRVGQETVLWGQSLFFTNNGIAAGQAPIDVISAQSQANPQAQQVFLPVPQAELTWQPNQMVTFQAYYQFEWQPDNLQAVGAYFSQGDILDRGGQRLIFGPGEYLFRAADLRPPTENGQFGGSVQFAIANYDFGFYGLRFDAKSPQVYLQPGAVHPTANGVSAGNYYLVYPRDIQIYGTSLSTTVGAANIAGEVSVRRNMPLVSGTLISTPANPGNAGSDPLYAVGTTLHGQASIIYGTPALSWDPGGIIVSGEVEANHVLAVNENRNMIAPSRSPTAAALEVVVTPTYYIGNWQVGLPIGLTWNFYGKSMIDSTMNHGTGSFSFGVQGTYRQTWIASLTYNDYLGRPDPTYNALADRGYVSLNLQHTF
jgi:hypothetical protein